MVLRQALPEEVKLEMTGLMAAIPAIHPDCA